MGQVIKTVQTTNAQVLRDETVTSANTSLRVYNLIKDLIDSALFYDQVEQVTGVSLTSVMSQNAVSNLIAGLESLSNKATNFSTLNNNLYPSILAVNNRIVELIEGIKYKTSCRLATTGNITLSGLQVIDGSLTVVNDRVNVKDNTDPKENGLYLAKVGAWVRTTDADTGAELEGAIVEISEGTANADTVWLQISDSVTIGSTNIVWTQFGSGVPPASPTTAGKLKLFATTGSGTDGTMDQNSVTNALAAKVTGPGSATDSAVVLYDGTTGKLIKNSTILPTTVGIAIANLANPSAITFIRINADNTVTARSAANFLSDIGAQAALSIASQSDMITGTDNAKMVTALGAESKRSIKSQSFSNSATGSSTIDCGSRQENKVVYNTTVTGAITIALSNASNLETLHIVIPITGSNIAITFPSTTRMSRYNEVSSGDGWYYSTYILQVSSIGTADLHEFSLVKSGSVFKLNYDGPARG